MTSDGHLSELPPTDSGGRRLKKRSIAAKLADKDRRHADNESITGSDIGATDLLTSIASNERLKDASQIGIEDASDRDLFNGWSNRQRRRSLRPSVSDIGVVKSASKHSRGLSNGGVSGAKSDEPDRLVQSKSETVLESKFKTGKNTTESPRGRLRYIKMSPDAQVSQYKHLPTPPTTPRVSTKGEKRVRDPYSSSEEHEFVDGRDGILWNKSRRSSIFTSALNRCSSESVDTGTGTDNDDDLIDALNTNSSQLKNYNNNTTDEELDGKTGSRSHKKSYIDTDKLSQNTETRTSLLERGNTEKLLQNTETRTSLLERRNTEKLLQHTETKTLLKRDSLEKNILSDTNSLNFDELLIDNKNESSHVRSNRLTPLSPAVPTPNLPPLPDVSSRALRTAHKSETSTTRDILLERMDSLGEYKSADSVSVGSNSGLPVIFTHQVKNKGINLNASSQSNASILGADELSRYLPDRKLNIFIGSWNMCEIKTCPISLDDFILPSSTKVLLDMYVIGTQENAMNKKEWEIQLQETLGLSHVLLYSATHGALHIAVFVRRDLMWFYTGVYRKLLVISKRRTCAVLARWAHSVSNHLYWAASSSKGVSQMVLDRWLSVANHICDIHENHTANFPQCLHGPIQREWLQKGLDWDCVSTRAISVVRTKGAVAVSLTFFGTTMLFVNSHLTCDSSKSKSRMADYEKIIRDLRLPKDTLEGSILTRYDCIFWCGDLNFRIDKGRSNVDVMLGALTTQDHPNFEDLIAGDQLYKYICEGRIFQDFQEGRITFSPTYKFDIGSDKYDTSSKMRIPSYTDRVLFRSRVKSSITCVCYDAVMDIKVSDHRPVYAQFQASVRPALDGVQQVSELKFDKAVYIEASRRRGFQQQISKKGEKNSSVCSLM